MIIQRLVIAAMSMGLSTFSAAGILQLSSAAALSSGSAVHSFPDALGSSYSDTASYAVGGNTLTFSASGETLTRFEAGVDYLTTAFSTNTQLLFASGSFGASAPVRLSFATPVLEVGFGLEEAAFGDYVITFTAFNGATSLGTFTASGNDPDHLSFVGATATAGDVITSLLISDDQGNDLAFGPIAFGTSTEPPPPPPPVSAPASLALLVLGLGILTRMRRLSFR